MPLEFIRQSMLADEGLEYVHLDGIVVREPQPGWVTLQVPLLEAWESRLLWLLPEQRERVETPEFFQLVQQHVTRRYLALKPKGA